MFSASLLFLSCPISLYASGAFTIPSLFFSMLLMAFSGLLFCVYLLRPTVDLSRAPSILTLLSLLTSLYIFNRSANPPSQSMLISPKVARDCCVSRILFILFLCLLLGVSMIVMILMIVVVVLSIVPCWVLRILFLSFAPCLVSALRRCYPWLWLALRAMLIWTAKPSRCQAYHLHTFRIPCGLMFTFAHFPLSSMWIRNR